MTMDPLFYQLCCLDDGRKTNAGMIGEVTVVTDEDLNQLSFYLITRTCWKKLHLPQKSLGRARKYTLSA